MPRVELLFFAGCPHVEEARESLREALRRAGRGPSWAEVDLAAPALPPGYAGFGSPTILVDGRDVSGGDAGDAVGCRVYRDAEGRRTSAPSVEAIEAALRR